MERFENLVLDQERALYGLNGAEVVRCLFEGPADGESALKEASDITVESCEFRLRYPFWHVRGGKVVNSTLTDTCRAALWYAEDMTIESSTLGGIKALRECDRMALTGCAVDSAEFGWSVRGMEMADCTVKGEYFMLRSDHLHFRNVTLKGKYSFQYIENCVFEDCNFDTKDAFWHAKNVTVRNSVIKGEYLAWFSEGLTLINCRIIGTQPLCYCKDLKLIDCTMEDTDLSFEYSDVQATVKGHIHSVKNPRSGQITADSVGEVIMEDAVMECTGKVTIR